MSRSKLPPLKEPVADVRDAQCYQTAPAKPRRKQKIDNDVESVAESTGSRNLPDRSVSHTYAIDNGDAGNESQNNATTTPTRSKKRRKLAAGTQEDVVDCQHRPTARKKKGKKRTRPSSDSLGLATELHDLAEDIVGEDGAAECVMVGQTITDPVATLAMKSEPTQKVFTETKNMSAPATVQHYCSDLISGCGAGGFKATNKARLAQKRSQAARAVSNAPQDVAQMNTIQFALKTHRCFRIIAIFLLGLFAGITLWHIVASYMLIDAGSSVFIQYYTLYAIPVHCLYFFLFAVATVYALDRYDLASPTRELLVKSVSLQAGTICVFFYLTGLILSLVMAPLDERIGVLDRFAMDNTSTDLPKPQIPAAHATKVSHLAVSSDRSWLQEWAVLNVARGVLAMLGWFVVSLSPSTDRLSKTLLKANDEFLQPNTVTRQLQAN